MKRKRRRAPKINLYQQAVNKTLVSFKHRQLVCIVVPFVHVANFMLQENSFVMSIKLSAHHGQEKPFADAAIFLHSDVES